MKRLYDLLISIMAQFRRLGAIISNDDSGTCSTGAYLHKGHVKLTEGTWLVIGTAVFAANATGNRLMLFNQSASSTTSFGYAYADRRYAAGGTGVQTYTKTQFVRQISSGSTEDWYMHTYQNSGSSLTVYTRIQAVRVG